MLTPDYLDHCTDDIVRLYQQLEDAIVRDIARRLVATEFQMTQSAVWQMEKLQQAGVLYDEALRQIAQATGRSERELYQLFEEGGTETLRYDDGVYERAGLHPLPIKQSPGMLQLLAAGYTKCLQTLQNLTRTTANTAQTAFLQACDEAYMQVASGAFDYNTAIRRAVQRAGERGAYVLYPSGHRDRLDVAVRRAVLTGVSQTCGQLQVMRMDEMGCDLVEVTAHMGARPSHAVWQGRVFSRTGRGGYPPFAETTGYGTGAGLMGWNCRHNFYPFYEGISTPNYTEAELRELEEHTVSFGGRAYKDYEASQLQRKMERDIRATKRTLVGLDEAAKATADEAVKRGLQSDFGRYSVTLGQQEAALSDFLAQTARKEERARVQVAGFGRSEAARAAAAARKEVEKYEKIRYNKDGTIVVTDDWKAREHVSIPSTYQPNAVVETVSRNGKQVDRTIYGPDARMKKQINSGNHGNAARHPFGNHGEHAHDILWDGDTIRSTRKPRELTDAERKEHGDIL